MMQLEPMFQPSWPVHSYFDSPLDQYGQNIDFFTSEEDNEFYSANVMNGLDDVCRWLCDDGDDVQKLEEISSDRYEWSPSISKTSSDSCAYIPYVTPPCMVDDLMEIDSQTGIENLLMAHAEAVCSGHTELAKVIQKHVCQLASPVGPVLERLALNLFQCDDNQEKDYIVQESLRNFKTAFRAFYEIFPYGRFAHFTANSTILESIPTHATSIHIVDFELCGGSQWPPVIEAIARINKTLIITSIKLDQDQDSKFKQTRWQLCNFARSFGLNLKVQEMGMSQMVKTMDESKLVSEFIVFNCMVSLPHMGRTRKTTQVMDFLNIAKWALAKNEGIITFGDGEGERTNDTDFPSFFNKNLAHYKALYESMEWGFPSYLNEGRMAIETLFVWPFVNSKSWFQKWEEGRGKPSFQKDIGLRGVQLSKENLNEQWELVNEGETPYGIEIGESRNEFVLKWKETPLVRVSAWM
ncbi:putative transcription factor GRAS family [Helianthus anomalus]